MENGGFLLLNIWLKLTQFQVLFLGLESWWMSIFDGISTYGTQWCSHISGKGRWQRDRGHVECNNGGISFLFNFNWIIV